MRIEEFLKEIEELRMLGWIIPSFMGMGAIGPIAVMFPEHIARPVYYNANLATKWAFTGITALAFKWFKRLWLSYQVSDAAAALGLSEEDAYTIDFAEGMALGHNVSLRRKIIAAYGLTEGNEAQRYIALTYTTPAWHGRAYVPPVENPFLCGGGIHLPELEA